jgi:menaquinone-dependent protoporphyrinogen IX oxidase
MKALVVYHLVYGNTEKIAQAMATGLGSSDEVKALRPAGVTRADMESIDFLIVGSPIQGGRQTPAMREFLSAIPANALTQVNVAALDTGLESMRRCSSPDRKALPLAPSFPST